MTWIFIILGGIYVLGRLIPWLGQNITRFYPLSGSLAIFWVWLTSLAFSQALYNRQLRIIWRLSLGILLICIFFINFILARYWTSGWLPAMISILVILVIYKPRVVLPILLLFAMGVILNPQIVLGTIMGGDNNEFTMSARTEAWRIVLEIASINPLFGVGPGNYYWYTPNFSILGWHVNFNSHNNYVDILAQTGIAGLVSFFWLVGTVGVIGWQIKSRVPEGFPRAYVIGSIGGLIGTLVSGMFGDWFLPFIYNVGYTGFRSSVLFWLFLGGIVVLDNIYQQRGIDDNIH
jgi:O-antigen ligase